MNRVQRNKIGLAIFIYALVTATVHLGFAQVTASINGRVTDPSGASIPGAKITVTNVETGTSRSVNSDESGNYRALSLPVGAYELRAEREGFKAAIQSGIHLVVGQQAVVNMGLEVGAVQEQVTVMSEAPLVNTTTSSVAGLVGEREVKDLPLNGRSFDLLITLNPGAVNYSSMKSAASAGAGEGNYFSVAGRRPSENLFLLNGVEYTGASIVGITPGGVSGQLLGIDAIREFNVQSNAYSVEYGKRAGAQVSVVTQSGTNSIHGSGFEFLRNSKLDARNFFDRDKIAPFKRNQFGGSLGGPIRKDRTFLFGSYEGFRQRLGVSLVTFVPDANARKGLLPDANGVPTPVPGLAPGILPYLNALWPAPNGQNRGGGIAEAFSNPKQSIREDFGTARFDHTFSVGDSLSAVHTSDDGFSLNPMSDPVFSGSVALRSQVTSLQEIHIFSPSVINTATLGFSRAGFNFDSPATVPLPALTPFISGKPIGAFLLGAGSATGAASVTPSGPNNPNNHFIRNLFTYSDGLQIVKGKHQINAGVWFQQIRANEQATPRAWGTATFATMTTLLQGISSQFLAAPISTAMGWRSLEGAWYLQDGIQVTPRFNLRVGLRHEFTNGWSESTGRASNFVFDKSGLIATNPRVGNSPFSVNNSKKLFSPRAALAWDLFGNGKTSIRAGFGTHFDILDATVFLLDGVAPFNGSAAFANVPVLSLIPIPAGTPLPPACGPGVPNPCTTYSPTGFQDNFKTPTVYSWNFAIEQQVTKDTVLRLGYVGSTGTHQFSGVDLNSIPAQVCNSATGCSAGGTMTAAQKGAADLRVPQGTLYIPAQPGGAPATRPNPYLSNASMLMAEGNSRYHALQIEVTRRLSHGFQFRGNYTWAKNIDINSSISASQSQNQAQTIMNPYNVQRDYGPSALNVKHQSSLSFSYELPFGQGKTWVNSKGGAADKIVGGWQFNSIVSLVSGFPFTPQIGSNRSGNGDTRNPDRPNLNPAFSNKVMVGTPDKWFDAQAFSLPTPGTFGVLGRGGYEGPGLANVDFSLFKSTKFTERLGLQFRAEVFNAFNRSNFGSPSPVIFNGTAYSGTAGRITSTATASRQIQFGMKLTF